MRKFIISYMVLILLSSCYGYKKVPRDFDSFKKGDRVQLVLNSKSRRGKIVEFKNDSLLLKKQNGKLEKISSTEILEVKKGKFSWLKSVVVPTASLGLVAYAALALAPLDLDFDWSGDEGQ